MKYEIATSSDDTLVLLINSRVVALSEDMSELFILIQEDYTNSKNKIKRSYNPVVIYPELDTYEDKPSVIENKDTYIPENGSLRKLLGL
jgi:hypothetical protein